MAIELVSKPHSRQLTLPLPNEHSPGGHENHVVVDERVDSFEELEGDPATRVETVFTQYSIFSKHVRRYVIFTTSWAAFFSPLSSQIYFPVLNTLASDLHVSSSLINLTLTSYMVGLLSTN
jgi:hypothetical protein